MSVEELAAQANLAPSTIRSYENGWRAPVRDTVETQIEAARGLQSHGDLLMLWDEFEEAMNYGSFPIFVADLADKEAAATTIRCYSLTVVPGLVQTANYARAILAVAFGITVEEIEQQVAERLQRQEILARDKPPELRVILDEWALYRQIGSREVMAEQVRRLIDEADKPSSTILVIPSDTGSHDGLSGEFKIVDTEGQPDFSFLETAVGGQPMPEADNVALLNRKWATLISEAASRKASRVLLEESYKRWTRTS